MTFDPPPSFSAWRVARHRARHQHHEGGRIFADPLASVLSGPSQDALLAEPDRPWEARSRRFIAARSRIAEDRLARAVQGGTRQLVVLGAGLETIGLRHPHAGEGLRIFEVDRPEMLAWKRARVAQAGLAIPEGVRLVPCDLERDGLLPRLQEAGFDPFRPVFFFCLGLLPYLTWEMNDALLRFISSLPRGEVVYDYYEPPEMLSGGELAYAENRTKALAEHGEVWRTDFSPRAMEDLLELTNFRWFEDLGAAEIAVLFGPAEGAPGADSGGHVVHARA